MRTYKHIDGVHTLSFRILADGVLVSVYDGQIRRFTRLFAKVGATLAQAQDITRNMALNPLKRGALRAFDNYRAAYQPQIWGADMAGALNRDFHGR